MTSQGLYYDTFVVVDPLPMKGQFQLLEDGTIISDAMNGNASRMKAITSSSVHCCHRAARRPDRL